jgi:hypothetical protein
MNRLTQLIREPALIVDAVETGLILLIALGLDLTTDQQAWTVALVVAVLGLVKAAATDPWPVTALTDLARAAGMFVVVYGLDQRLFGEVWSVDQIAVVVTALGTFLTAIQRAQITPSYSVRAVESPKTP